MAPRPSSSCRSGSENTSFTMPMPWWPWNLRWEAVTIPLDSWPRCCRLCSARYTYSAGLGTPQMPNTAQRSRMQVFAHTLT